MWGELFCIHRPAHGHHMSSTWQQLIPGTQGWGTSVIFGETENLGSSILAGHHTKLLVRVGLAEHWTGSLLSLKL